MTKNSVPALQAQLLQLRRDYMLLREEFTRLRNSGGPCAHAGVPPRHLSRRDGLLSAVVLPGGHATGERMSVHYLSWVGEKSFRSGQRVRAMPFSMR